MLSLTSNSKSLRSPKPKTKSLMIKPKGFNGSIAPFVSGNNAVLVLSGLDSAKGLTPVSYLTVEISIDGSKEKPVVFKSKIDAKNVKSGITITGTSVMSVGAVSNVTAIVTIESRKKVSNPITISTRISPVGGKK